MAAKAEGQCQVISAILRDYLFSSTQWRTDFSAFLPTAVDASKADDEDFEATFKPGKEEVSARSCVTT